MSNHAEQLQNDVKLIQEVQKHLNLYDHRCKDNKDSKARDMSWITIGKKLKTPPDVCKNRWKNLRDKYTREKKLLMTESEESYRYHQWPLLEEMSFLWNFVSHRKLSTKNLSDGKQMKDKASEEESRQGWIQYGYREESNSDFLDPACVLVEEDGHIDPLTHDEEPQPKSKLRRLLQIKDEDNSDHSHHENLTDSNYHSDSVQSTRTVQLPRLDEEEYFCLSIAGTLRRLPKQKSSQVKIKILELLHKAQFGDSN